MFHGKEATSAVMFEKLNIGFPPKDALSVSSHYEFINRLWLVVTKLF